jgi:hypothetical protein
MTPAVAEIVALLERFAIRVADVNAGNRVPLLNRRPRWTFYFDVGAGCVVLLADMIVTTDPVGEVPTPANAKDGMWWSVAKQVHAAEDVKQQVAAMHSILMEKLFA